jgi:hypothetical protein
MKLCKDCKFFRAGWGPVFDGNCNRKTRNDLVWGGKVIIPISARIERELSGSCATHCGPDATYWEQAPAPVAVTVPESKSILKPWQVRLLNLFDKFL